MPYDAERVMQLRSMLREARKQKLSAGMGERREKRAAMTPAIQSAQGDARMAAEASSAA